MSGTPVSARSHGSTTPEFRASPISPSMENTLASKPDAKAVEAIPSVPKPEAKAVEAGPPLPDWDDVSFSDEPNEEYIPEPFSKPQTQATPTVYAASKESVPLVSQPQVVLQPADTGATTASDAPILTIEKVKECWEYVKRRVKSKKDGAKIAALLNGYAIVGVEGTLALPIVVIRANADFFYSTLQQNTSHHATVEWAMKVELKQECKLRFYPPGQSVPALGSIPPRPPHDS